MLKLLLSKGADIEVRNDLGRTPLHEAAKCRNTDAAQVLVEHGANLNALDNDGKAPFDLAEDLETATYLGERTAEMFQNQGNYADAAQVYKKLFNIQMENIGHRFEVLETQRNIALMLFEDGKLDESMHMFEDVLNKRKNVLENYHFNTLLAKYDLGKVYLAQLKFDQAFECFKEVMENWQDTLGANHKETLKVARDLAFVHLKKGDNDEALELFSDVFENRKSSLGMEHPDTLQVWLDMAIVLADKGENENALGILKDIYDKRKVGLGADNPDTMLVAHHISVLSQRLKNTTQEKENVA